MGWTVEDVLDANPAGAGQSRSVVERLVTTGQVVLPFLARVADELESRNEHHVAAFFQLPFAVATEEGFLRVGPLLEAGLYADLTFSLYELTVGDDGGASLITASPERAPRWPVITQVAAIFPVQADRRRFHSKYLHHVERGTVGNPVFIQQADSWLQNRPMSLGDYERDVARNLPRQIMAGLRSLLPAYTVSSMSEAPVPDWLPAYYAMPAPGRIVLAGVPVPVTKALLQRNARALPEEQDLARIERAMDLKNRNFGRFETQLFILERLRLDGELALSLVGGSSLLEWVLKSIVAHAGETWTRSWRDLKDYPSLQFLSDEDRAALDAAREMRNKLAHEAPPLRRSITLAGPAAGRQAQSNDLSSDAVKMTLQIAFKAFKEANLRKVPLADFVID